MLKKRYLIATITLLFICPPQLNGCKAKSRVKSEQPSGGVLSKSEQEDDIREAVFRYQFDHNASAAKKRTKAYYLSLSDINGKRDPSDKFMQRFKGHKPVVRKISQAEDSGGVTRGGLIFYAGEIKWKTDNEVEVSGGYYEGNMSSSGNKYLVVREGGKWIVKKDVMEWIS